MIGRARRPIIDPKKKYIFLKLLINSMVRYITTKVKAVPKSGCIATNNVGIPIKIMDLRTVHQRSIKSTLSLKYFASTITRKTLAISDGWN
jgi:hypothetical protein